MNQPGIATQLADYLNSDPRIEGPIELDTELVESGRIDSLAILDLIVFVEERFGVSLAADDLTSQNLASVSALASLVAGRI